MSTRQIIDGWEHGHEPYSETPIAIEPNLTTRQATDCTHNQMIETHDNPIWAWQCADCGYIYGKHGTPKPDFPR